MRRSWRLLAVVVWLLVPGVSAQSSVGQVHGVVTDERGGVLPGVTITAARFDGDLPARKTISDAKGRFGFPALEPGWWTISADLQGFTRSLQYVEVTTGSIAQVTLVMSLSALAETVTVAPLPPGLQHRRGGTGGGVYRPHAVPATLPAAPSQYFNTESYARVTDNAWQRVRDRPLSTFSVDVDTASYANVRRFLTQGELPPPDAVRIEELVNYFSYDYPAPEGEKPFSVSLARDACPWNRSHELVLVGLQGRRIDDENLPPRNLVFLLDVSGSMHTPQKLPLVKAAMSMLAGHLAARDRIAIVVYAGASGLVLPSTRGDDRGRILAAISGLEAGGSTNGGDGIRLAYRVAGDAFIDGGVNRVILATDGDFNVGVTDEGQLTRLIEDKRRSGIALSVLGFGMGNLKDSMLEKLADLGNGNYAYIDTLLEAQKVLVTEAAATLVTIAKDVKLQVEFNPAEVGAYRLVGYENRVLEDRDFNDDAKDAGDIGAGHAVTALYEIVRAGAPLDVPGVDPLKYQAPTQPSAAASSGELLTVKLRYKAPDGDTSRLLSVPLPSGGRRGDDRNLAFASAVAEFGMLLRGSEARADASFAHVLAAARQARGDDPHGHRAEFIRLVGIADALVGTRTRKRDRGPESD